MLRASSDLLADVGEDDLAVHDAEDTFIDRHDGAMAAEMFATAAGLGGTDDAKAIAGNYEVGVLRDGRQVDAIGDLELEALEGNQRLGLHGRKRRGRAQARP